MPTNNYFVFFWKICTVLVEVIAEIEDVLLFLLLIKPSYQYKIIE